MELQRSDTELLKEFFEFETCAECRRGERSHTVVRMDLGAYGPMVFFQCQPKRQRTKASNA